MSNLKMGGVAMESSGHGASPALHEPPAWAMNVRAVLAVVVGYSVFSGGLLGFFALSGRDPRGHHPLPFLLLSGVVGLMYSMLAGYLCVAMIGKTALGPAIALAGLIAVDALVSLAFLPHGGSAWPQIATSLVFAPAVVAGGALRRAGAGAAPRPEDRVL
jgi:hypothetical protein